MVAIALTAAGLGSAVLLALLATGLRRRERARRRRRIARDERARLNGWLHAWLWSRHRRKRLTHRPGSDTPLGPG